MPIGCQELIVNRPPCHIHPSLPFTTKLFLTRERRPMTHQGQYTRTSLPHPRQTPKPHSNQQWGLQEGLGAVPTAPSLSGAPFVTNPHRKIITKGENPDFISF